MKIYRILTAPVYGIMLALEKCGFKDLKMVELYLYSVYIITMVLYTIVLCYVLCYKIYLYLEWIY